MTPINIFDYPYPKVPRFKPVPMPPLVELAWNMYYTTWVTPFMFTGMVYAAIIQEADRAIYNHD
jgi:hypothetical protein